MRVTLKNAEAVYINLASKPHRLEIDGADPDDLLCHIDIITAINYYGITELLDTIGDEELKLHLGCL